VQSTNNPNIIERYNLDKKGKIICFGQSVGNKIGAGIANRIMGVKDISKFKPGQVLITDMTDPDWEPIMKIASAIVTDKGSRTCHAAIVSRELGIPCVVGAKNASKKIKSNKKITVSCAEGEVGYVYSGELPFKIEKTNIKDLKRPKTKIMLNIGEPDKAFLNSFIPNNGVGLARLEFIINNYIKIHPLALVNYKKIKQGGEKQKIDRLTASYDNKKQYFVERLAQGMAMIAAAFYPKDVIFRLSDFKSNEYANLIGGKEYEPIEANPMIGYRGASRYYSKKFLPAFKLECQAVKMVREKMKLNNLKLMVPFCRTIEEGEKVLEIMKQNGLKRGDNGLEIYVMAEVPSNIILADKFSKIFDGFSIGSNDLTQLALGIDRDSGGTLEVLGCSDERNEAVKELIKNIIIIAKKKKKKIGICGQGPSDFPELASFLVGLGIDSLSLTPDSAVATTIEVYKTEKKLKRQRSLLNLFF
jgi:pyruvate, water dikinase